MPAVQASGRVGWRETRVSSATAALSVGLVLVALFAVLRTVGAPEAVIFGWTAAAAVASIFSPLVGLTVLAAIGPFTEAVTDEGRITAVPYLLAALGLGVVLVAVRRALTGGLRRPPLPVALALILFVGTLLSVGLTALSFGSGRGQQALELWVAGIGGGLTVMFAAWLVARAGEFRPLVILLASIALAALLSVVDVLLGGVVRESLFGWLLRSEVGPERLTGVIPAPNPAAMIFLVALPFTLIGTLSVRNVATWLLAAAATAVLVGAIVLTYSRSGLIALAVVVAVLAWHYRRWLGLAAVVAFITLAGLAVLLVPGLNVVRDVPLWADEARLAAWSASVEMWLAAPLTGHGLRSFEWLHAAYGTTLDAPHNEWLRFFAEGGIVVGLAALAFAAASLVTMLRRRNLVAAGGAVVLTALFVMASFNNPLMYVQVTVPLFLALGIALAARRVTHG